MPQEKQYQVKWDGRRVPAIIRVVPCDHRDDAMVFERALTDDNSLKQWMDSVIVLAMQNEGIQDIGVICKDVEVQESSDTGEVIAWTLRRCRPLSYTAHPARSGGPVTPDSAERLVVQYEAEESDSL